MCLQHLIGDYSAVKMCAKYLCIMHADSVAHCITCCTAALAHCITCCQLLQSCCRLLSVTTFRSLPINRSAGRRKKRAPGLQVQPEDIQYTGKRKQVPANGPGVGHAKKRRSRRSGTRTEPRRTGREWFGKKILKHFEEPKGEFVGTITSATEDVDEGPEDLLTFYVIYEDGTKETWSELEVTQGHVLWCKEEELQRQVEELKALKGDTQQVLALTKS